jgi:hypothetical protein
MPNERPEGPFLTLLNISLYVMNTNINSETEQATNFENYLVIRTDAWL